MQDNGTRKQRGIVAIAGSAGGLEAMFQILPSLPADFPWPVIYVHHLYDSKSCVLPEVLQWSAALKVRWAHQGDRLEAGVLYLCPPGCSSFVHPDGTITLNRMDTRLDMLYGADRLLASVADSYQERAVAVVLSGCGYDSSEGVCAVRARGGTVLAQSEASAGHCSMPRAAIATGCVDLVLRLEDIAPVLINLVRDGHSLDALRTNGWRFKQRGCIPVSQDLRKTSEKLLAMALRMHGTDMGNVQILEPQTGNLSIVAQRGFGFDFLQRFESVTCEDESACGRALRLHRPVFISDIDDDPLFAVHRDVALGAGFRAVQSIPLINGDGSLLGVLSTHFRTPRALSTAKLHWLYGRHANALVHQVATTNQATSLV